MPIPEQVSPPERSSKVLAPVSGLSRRARVFRWLLLMAAFALLLVSLSWWYVLTQIVPKIDQWRLPLSQEVSRQLGGSRLEIGRMSASVDGLWPVLRMDHVRIVDAQGREGLRLPHMTATLSAASLTPLAWWQQRVVFRQVRLEQPLLQVRRDAQGHWWVAGVRLSDTPSAAPEDDHPALAWLLAQRQIVVSRGVVVWRDDVMHAGTQGDLTATTLQQVDIEMHSTHHWWGRQHHWQLQATPPKLQAQRFTWETDIRQPWWLTGTTSANSTRVTQLGDWSSWSGKSTLKLPWLDVQALRAWWPLPSDIQGGQGAVDLTLDIAQGQAREVGMDVRVQGLSVRLGDGLQPLAFRSLTGALAWVHEPARTRLSWQRLAFVTDEGLLWPASQARLELKRPPALQSRGTAQAWWQALASDWAQPGLQGQLSTNRVDINLLNRLADRLPLPATFREQLAALAPQGIGEDLNYAWHGPLQAPVNYRLQGKLKGLSWMAGAAYPGLSGATMRIDASRESGQAELDIQRGWVEFPGVFDEPRIPVNVLKSQLQWKRLPAAAAAQAPGWQLEVKQADFANDDAQGRLHAVWRTADASTGPALPGVLDMQGRLSQAQGNRVWRYLPAVIHPQARDYVRQAVRSGIATDVDFLVKGPLASFPFKDNQGGIFRIQAQANDVELAYAAGWPAFTQLKGLLIFEGQGMRIEQAHARLGSVGTGSFEVHEVKGQIPDLDTPDPVLTMEGRGQGPLDDILRFVNVSPVGQWTGAMLNNAQAQGQGRLSLAIALPLQRVEAGTVKGQIELAPADQALVKLAPSAPALQSAVGTLQFTQDTLQVKATAQVWGQAITLQGVRDAQGAPRFTAKGMLNADALRQASDMPALSRLARHVKGQAPVEVNVTLMRRKSTEQGGWLTQPELQVSSSLQGLALDLPSPLNKPAQASWPLTLTQRAEPHGRSDTLALLWGAGDLQLKADYRRDLQGKSPRVVKGVLQASQGVVPAWPAAPATGVVARVWLPSLDVQSWREVWDLWQTQMPANKKGPPLATQAAGDFGEYLPAQVQFKTAALRWQQRTLRDMTVLLYRPAPEVWAARIASPQMTGDLEWRPDEVARPGGGRLVARLNKLSIPASEATLVNEHTTREAFQTSVPALDIVIDQFEWKGMPLGRLELQAVNRLLVNPGQPVTPEWRLTRLALTNPDAQLEATGNWALVGAQQTPASSAAAPVTSPARHRAAFNFTLELDNSGGLLTRLGMPQTIKGGKGKLSGQLSWLGSPLTPDAPSMNGHMNVSLQEGQFLKADPGVAKLFGVLSLQSLPRRLTLDFRDVFQQGFAFDKVEGDVQMTAGVAQTRNLRMRGVQALVLMEGQADLDKETQNLKVFVVPEINAGTASLAYAVINPAIGLGTFIAQVLLRKSVIEANTREFAITGTWANPKVEQVQRSEPRPVQPSTDVPAANAPAPQVSAPPSGRDNGPPGSTDGL